MLVVTDVWQLPESLLANLVPGCMDCSHVRLHHCDSSMSLATAEGTYTDCCGAGQGLQALSWRWARWHRFKRSRSDDRPVMFEVRPMWLPARWPSGSLRDWWLQPGGTQQPHMIPCLMPGTTSVVASC